MARKNKNEQVILENVELKPQVIGYVYKKKSNVGRVIFIFIVFCLAIYFINDITVFMNTLIGKSTPKEIVDLKEEDNNIFNNSSNSNQVIYNTYSNDLTIYGDNIIINSFNLSNNTLSFKVLNNLDNGVDLSNKLYYLELYNEDKTLVERLNLDLGVFNPKEEKDYSYTVSSSFVYISFLEKDMTNYEEVILDDSNKLTCTKDNITVVYSFSNNLLDSISSTIINNNVSDSNYYTLYNLYQTKSTNYNSIEGVSSTFSPSLSGYTFNVSVSLASVNTSSFEEDYYFNYKDNVKIVKNDIEAKGYSCKVGG